VSTNYLNVVRDPSVVQERAYLKDPLQILEVVRINSLNIVVSDLHSQNVLIERSCEVNIEQLSIKQCLGNLDPISIVCILVKALVMKRKTLGIHLSTQRKHLGPALLQ